MEGVSHKNDHWVKLADREYQWRLLARMFVCADYIVYI